MPTLVHRRPLHAALTSMMLAAAAPALLGQGTVPTQSTAQAAAAPATNPVPAVQKQVFVRLATTFGDVVLELDNEKAPITVANFIRYLDRGDYDNTLIHRAIKGSLIQGGGFAQNLAPRPTDPPIINESSNGLRNVRGTIAMARLDEPNSANNQFFINISDHPDLDGAQGKPGYAVFGKVIGGMDVVDAIAQVPVVFQQQVGEATYPREPVYVLKASRLTAEQAAGAAKEADASGEKAKAELKKRTDPLTTEAQFNDAKDFLLGKGIDISKGVKAPDGLWSVELEPGEGASPSDSDTVRFSITEWLVNGKQVESSAQMKRLPEFTLSLLPLKGVAETLKQMHPGGRRYVFIPPELAWGEHGGSTVPPGSALVCELQLAGVDHFDALPAPDKQFDAALEFLKSRGVDISQGKKTDTGLWAYDAVVGTGEQPKPTDNVKANYTGWLVNGRKFDSSVDPGRAPATFYLNQTMPGWSQGILPMKVGGKRWLVMPPSLAFGAAGLPRSGITPEATLVFEVELLGITNENKGVPEKPEPVLSQEQQFDKAMEYLKSLKLDVSTGVKSPSGLWVLDTKPGTGEQPKPSDQVTVDYIGWLVDGRKFDASNDHGGSTTLPLSAFVPGWIEGIGGMKAGGRRYLVVPSGLAYGDQGSGVIPPKATLVFQVDLVAVNKK